MSHQPFLTQVRTANMTAPAASAAKPPRNCSRVAPAAIPTDTRIAIAGTTGPKRTTKVAGFTTPAKLGDRSRSVAAETPTYITSRASALTTASLANEPVRARTTATADVNSTAL